LINQFFDTVDEYLNGAEDKLLENVDAFFENLASEMGIDTSTLSDAKDSMVSSITNFFDNVDQAIESVRISYIPEQELPENTEPQQIPDTTLNPELAETSEVLAEALYRFEVI